MTFLLTSLVEYPSWDSRIVVAQSWSYKLNSFSVWIIVWFYHANSKGDLMSESFSLWFKSQKKVCQITPLGIFRWIVTLFVRRFEPNGKTFWDYATFSCLNFFVGNSDRNSFWTSDQALWIEEKQTNSGALKIASPSNFRLIPQFTFCFSCLWPSLSWLQPNKTMKIYFVK